MGFEWVGGGGGGGLGSRGFRGSRVFWSGVFGVEVFWGVWVGPLALLTNIISPTGPHIYPELRLCSPFLKTWASLFSCSQQQVTLWAAILPGLPSDLTLSTILVGAGSLPGPP